MIDILLLGALSVMLTILFVLIAKLTWAVISMRIKPREAGRAGDVRLIDSHDKLRWLIEL